MIIPVIFRCMKFPPTIPAEMLIIMEQKEGNSMRGGADRHNIGSVSDTCCAGAVHQEGVTVKMRGIEGGQGQKGQSPGVVADKGAATPGHQITSLMKNHCPHEGDAESVKIQ
jgi:hypothetical protein